MNEDALAAVQRELDAIDALVSRTRSDDDVQHAGFEVDAPPVEQSLTEGLDDEALESSRAHQCADHGLFVFQKEYFLLLINNNSARWFVLWFFQI